MPIKKISSHSYKIRKHRKHQTKYSSNVLKAIQEPEENESKNQDEVKNGKNNDNRSNQKPQLDKETKVLFRKEDSTEKQRGESKNSPIKKMKKIKKRKHRREEITQLTNIQENNVKSHPKLFQEAVYCQINNPVKYKMKNDKTLEEVKELYRKLRKERKRSKEKPEEDKSTKNSKENKNRENKQKQDKRLTHKSKEDNDKSGKRIKKKTACLELGPYEKYFSWHKKSHKTELPEDSTLNEQKIQQIVGREIQQHFNKLNTLLDSKFDTILKMQNEKFNKSPEEVKPTETSPEKVRRSSMSPLKAVKEEAKSENVGSMRNQLMVLGHADIDQIPQRLQENCVKHHKRKMHRNHHPENTEAEINHDKAKRKRSKDLLKVETDEFASQKHFRAAPPIPLKNDEKIYLLNRNIVSIMSIVPQSKLKKLSKANPSQGSNRIVDYDFVEKRKETPRFQRYYKYYHDRDKPTKLSVIPVNSEVRYQSSGEEVLVRKKKRIMFSIYSTNYQIAPIAADPKPSRKIKIQSPIVVVNIQPVEEKPRIIDNKKLRAKSETWYSPKIHPGVTKHKSDVFLEGYRGKKVMKSLLVDFKINSVRRANKITNTLTNNQKKTAQKDTATSAIRLVESRKNNADKSCKVVQTLRTKLIDASISGTNVKNVDVSVGTSKTNVTKAPKCRYPIYLRKSPTPKVSTAVSPIQIIPEKPAVRDPPKKVYPLVPRVAKQLPKIKPKAKSAPPSRLGRISEQQAEVKPTILKKPLDKSRPSSANHYQYDDSKLIRTDGNLKKSKSLVCIDCSVKQVSYGGSMISSFMEKYTSSPQARVIHTPASTQPNVSSFLLTKTEKSNEMSAFQKRKIFGQQLRNLKGKEPRSKVSTPIYEVRLLSTVSQATVDKVTVEKIRNLQLEARKASGKRSLTLDTFNPKVLSQLKNKKLIWAKSKSNDRIVIEPPMAVSEKNTVAFSQLSKKCSGTTNLKSKQTNEPEVEVIFPVVHTESSENGSRIMEDNSFFNSILPKLTETASLPERGYSSTFSYIYSDKGLPSLTEPIINFAEQVSPINLCNSDESGYSSAKSVKSISFFKKPKIAALFCPPVEKNIFRGTEIVEEDSREQSSSCLTREEPSSLCDLSSVSFISKEDEEVSVTVEHNPEDIVLSLQQSPDIESPSHNLFDTTAEGNCQELTQSSCHELVRKSSSCQHVLLCLEADTSQKSSIIEEDSFVELSGLYQLIFPNKIQNVKLAFTVQIDNIRIHEDDSEEISRTNSRKFINDVMKGYKKHIALCDVLYKEEEFKVEVTEKKSLLERIFPKKQLVNQEEEMDDNIETLAFRNIAADSARSLSMLVNAVNVHEDIDGEIEIRSIYKLMKNIDMGLFIVKKIVDPINDRDETRSQLVDSLKACHELAQKQAKKLKKKLSSENNDLLKLLIVKNRIAILYDIDIIVRRIIQKTIKSEDELEKFVCSLAGSDGKLPVKE